MREASGEGPRSRGRPVKADTDEDRQDDQDRRRQVQRLPGLRGDLLRVFTRCPKFSSTNPARSRIRVTRDPLEDIYLPVYAGEYTASEVCGPRQVQDRREGVRGVRLLPRLLPVAGPLQGARLRPPSEVRHVRVGSDLDEPWCVQWCLADALVYEEREEEEEKADTVEELDLGSGGDGEQARLGRRCSTPCAGWRRQGLMSERTMETVEPLFEEIVEEIKEAGGEAFTFCYQCGKCDVVCPWNRVREFSIRKIVRQATFGLPDIELEDIWRCTTCGTCPVRVPQGRGADRGGGRPAQDRHGLRRVPGGRCRGALGRLEPRHRRQPPGRSERAAGCLGQRPVAEAVRRGMEVLYFVGCYYSYDPRHDRRWRSPRPTS